jgi:hypothetical protein
MLQFIVILSLLRDRGKMTVDATAPNSIRSALYYPFPYVQNENWLKEQALFWDHLYRIVPIGFHEMEIRGQRIDPTATERQLNDELGFIRDCQLDQGTQLAATAERLRRLMFHSEWLQYIDSSDEREYFTWGSLEGVKGIQPDPEEDFFTPSGAWRYIPGMVYMALLAKIISASQGLPVLTDDSEHDSVLKLDDLADEAEDIPAGMRFELMRRIGRPANVLGENPWSQDPSQGIALLYSVLLSRIGCDNLEGISVGDIIRFRQSHDGERRDFADELQRLAAGLKGRRFVSEAELRQYLIECAEKIDAKRRTLISAMRGNAMDAVLRSSAISAPLVVAAATGGLPQIGAAIGGALGTAAVLYGSRRVRRTDMLKDSAVTYTFLMSKELSPHNYMRRSIPIRLRQNRRDWR